MGFGDWLRAFRELHQRAKAGKLSPGEQETYRHGRDELARALLAAQQVMLRTGEVPRRQLRVARALQVELEIGKQKVKGLTQDVSPGGFGLLLATPPQPGDQVRCALRLPGQDPVAGVARVADVKVLPGNARAAFAWVNLPAADTDRLETFVFDAVLQQLAS
ncbi:MAG: PilZ domain-containing protein [Deltaproteobacteria bacterium]|nr:PilZ domain-containing protein [Deltaproteobacteria bacterium]